MSKTILAVAAALFAVAVSPTAATASTFNTLNGDAPIVIAHRGASGYLPEHTLGGYELAIQLGADFIEPDLLLTSDGHLVAMHDTTLLRTTNVRELFPERTDYSVNAFTLEEIKTLTVQPFGPQASFEYPGFTPSMPDPFKVPTFEEVLTFLNAQNAALGRNVGVYPEAKNPTSTLMNRQIVEQLRDAGFDSAADKVFIQSFNFSTLQELQNIQADLGTDMFQVALGGAFNVGGTWTVSGTPLTTIATYADGVGVGFNGASQAFVDAAHAAGLLVHVYTLRPFTQDGSDTLTEPLILRGIDGFFTDYTDRTLATLTPFLPEVAPVPVPLGALLLPSAILMLLGLRRRKMV